MKLSPFIYLCFVSFLSFSQLSAYPDNVGNVMTPSFFSSNYIITNLDYTGHPLAFGSFISDSTNLGLQKGIVLTTGLITGNNGPQGPNTNPAAGADNGAEGTSFIPDSYNAALLEFDIVSLVDTIKFRYVFGSEEYPEYVGSQFNDQFRILISGPGIVGYQNMSILPSGALVGVNSVNAASNSTFFVSNGDGSNAPYNQSSYYVQYDGFTVPLVAEMGVTPGELYHITILVTDVSDAILDSGVFIEQCESCDYNASIPEYSTELISCYPNPSFGEVTLQFPKLTTSAMLSVYNFLGEEIRTVDLDPASEKIILHDLNSASYVVKITSEGIVWTGSLQVF